MNVLVSGSEGYVGTVLVPRLEAAGHRVARMDSLLFDACRFEPGLEPQRESLAVRDIRDVQQQELVGLDAVIHLAGLSNDPLSDLAPELTRQINHSAALRFAALSKRAGVRRFVFSSTCSVYGLGGDELLTEDSPLDPLTPYAQSKRNAERELSALGDTAFEVVHLRHGTAYGYSPMIRFDLVVNNLVAWALTSGQILLRSDGNAWRPLVHVEDICAAFRAALEAPREAVAGEVFNIGRTEDNFRVRELAEAVALEMPGCRVVYAEGASPDKRSYRVDCSKALRGLPGFEPSWTLADGIRDLLERLGDLGGVDFEGPRFARIEHLKQRIANGSVDAELRPAS